MDSIRSIPPSSTSIIWKLCEICRKGIPIQEYDMVLVDGSDGFMQPVVQIDQAFMLRVRICGLVQDVVSCNPGIISVVGRELLPEPDKAVLEVFVSPEVT